MKLNKNGWGYRMMAFLMGLLIIALLVLFYLLYSYLDSVKGLELKTKNIEVVEKIYRNEFYNPMKQVIEAALGEERAKQVMEVDLWI